MEHENSIRLGISVSDAALYQQLARLAALWGQEMCVQLHVCPALAGSLHEADVLIWETGERDTAVEQWAASRHAAGHPAALIALAEDSHQAIASYRCHPNALLQRNAGYAQLSAALDRCFHVWSRGMIWLDLLYQRERVRVPLCQIQYVEAQGRNTRLQCTGGAIEVSKPLGQVAELLPQPPFLRCQKSFLVRLSAVEQVRSGTLIMSDGQEIPISRKQIQEVRQALEQWRCRF